MFVYSIRLIKLNRGVLPNPIKMGNGRRAAMLWSTLLFGVFSAIVIYNQIIAPILGTAPLLGG